MTNSIKTYTLVFTALFLMNGCSNSQEEIPQETKKKSAAISDSKKTPTFSLNDFLSSSEALNKQVEELFSELSNHQRVAQLIMPAIGDYGQEEATIDKLVRAQKIGGLLLLNGTKNQFSSWVKKYNDLNDSLQAPRFLYSADAEPSLINRKIKNTPDVPKANTLQTKKEVIATAQQINNELLEIGINYNFAPVVDMSPNQTVGWRSFGHQPDSVIPWSNAFISTTQSDNIIATAKHFPGHGFVEGDTHKKLVYIDGKMKEVNNYPPLIKNKVASIMIAHIAIRNNEQYGTEGLPASISTTIVQDLLRNELGFEGLVVTDAMNMGGVSSIEDAAFKAIKAGCDIVLMPLDASATHDRLLEAYSSNDELKPRIEKAVKRILRAKICLGLTAIK